MAKGVIFDLKRFCVHDGPGIRTTVFMKGCPLHCLWCHNPEGIQEQIQLVYRQTRCIRCGACIDACPHNAIRSNGKGQKIDRENCDVCGKCTFACSSEALTLAGREIEDLDLVKQIVADRMFFEESGGGATFSGGEPLVQADFLLGCLKECKRQGIHTAVDTCGYAPYGDYDRILPYVDLFLYDLKLIDDIRHVKYTGVSNQMIVENLALLADSGKEIMIVIPLVKDVNDDDANVKDIAEFAQDIGIGNFSILPYHRTGISKYEPLGIERPAEELESPTEERILEIEKTLLSYGLNVKRSGR
jgi:pyruvate formate lyase activating enzyme